MVIHDISRINDQALLDFDDMMTESIMKIENFAGLATAVWQDVLKELDKRGKVRLISGSYDNIGDALIERI